ncbi:MAG: BPL-N domain-containing protein [Rhodothermaceae bacterium]
MKKLILFAMLIFIVTACTKPVVKEDPKPIKIGVFDKNGDSPYCIADAVEAVKIDNEMDVRVISAAEILAGETDDLDLIIFPGGGGRSETGSLGELGQAKVIDFVKNKGKAVLGICAGAYILSETPDYPSLDLSAGEAIDIEHDHRGHGLVKFSLSEEGKKIFPELKGREINFSNYYEGPVLIPAAKSKYKYTELATMLSDVHTVEGTPANMTNNRPFIIITEVEKGKTASIVGHPESTAGMRWMIPRLIRVLTGNKIVSYSDNVVKPEIHTKEILFTKELLKEQRAAYYNLVESKEEKLKAMQDIVDMRAWSAKKWIPQMVRDSDFDVRLLAAKLTVYLERTDALKDLEVAVKIEKDPKQKAMLQEQFDLLKNIQESIK